MRSSSIPSPWRKALKYGAIGLGAFVWGNIIVSLVQQGPPPTAAETAQPVADSLAAQPVEAEPLAAPVAPPDTTAARAPVPVATPPAPPAPAPVAAPEPAPVATETKAKQAGPTVYITRTGTHYHRSGCSSLRKSREAISLDAVRGLMEPCGRCRPPR